MSDTTIEELRDLMQSFNDMNLSDFRSELASMVGRLEPLALTCLVEEYFKDWRGNRTMRSAIAAALANFEDEGLLDDFAETIERETDVSLCRECIQAISRMGSKKAHDCLLKLAKEKPNADIASLLRQELEKLNKQEPTTYYLENLFRGEGNPRQTQAASRILINLGDLNVLTVIFQRLSALDGLAQVEAARLVAELAKDEHFNQVFQYARQFFKEFQEARRLQKEIEELAGTEKAERLGQLMTFGQEWFESTHQGLWQTYIEKARTGEQSEAEALKEKLIDPKNRAHGFYVQYGALMVQNKMALASKYLEESSGMAKAVWARKRQVLSQFALALGRTAAHLQDHSDNRAQVTAFFESLFKLSNPDIERFVLFGLAPYLTPEESQLFPYIIASARVEGLTRLLKSLGKTKNPGFIPFFLRLASEHQLVDIQEMAMQGLSALPQVHDELRQMLNSKEQSQIRTAIRVIGNIQADELASSIIEMLPNSSDFLKMDIIVALGRLRNEVHLPLIQKILEDAKTPNLVTTCLNALGEMKTTAAVTHLRRFAETAQNRQSALVALDHYVRYFYRWDDPLPGDAHESVVRLVHEFGSDRQKEMRIKACQIASRVITWDLSLYQDLRNFFKDRNTVLRKQSNWDRAEMEQVEKSQKSLNRSFYFLKDALEQQERFETSLRKLATFQGGRWIEEAERLVALLEKAEFPLSPDFLGELNQVVKQQLPEKESWREWKCLFKLAGITKQPDLIPLLHTYIKRVPTQARDTLHDALVQLGKSLKEIEKATQIQSVIVLEASNFFRKKLVQFLEGLGLEAVGCETLSEVEKELQRAPRDCMITELTQVQQADLLDDLLRLKSHIKAPMEWILSTNCRDPQTLRKAITLQPKKVLLKPYSFEDLKAQLRP